MYSEDQDEIKLNILINSKGKDHLQVVTIDNAVNTLRRLRDVISSSIKNKYPLEKMIIYNHKGLELDEVDIQYLKNDQVLFVSLDGHPFDSGNYLNQFEFVKYLKSGGYGKIYIAKNIITNELVAIKKIETTYLTSEEIYNMSREAVYLESFKHKHIIKVYTSFLLNNSFYTIMQLAKGGELDAYLKEKKTIDEIEARRVFKMILEAVKYIHSKNVIHRDLNLVNILFIDENKDNIVIIDFGISGFCGGNVKEKINAGTIRFVPPEVASGSNISSTPKIDSWALGIILFVMLFGIYPFDGTNESDILHKIINQPYKFPNNNISKTCRSIITKLLEKNPNNRLDLSDDIFDNWFDEKIEIKTIVEEVKEVDESSYNYSHLNLERIKEIINSSSTKVNSNETKKPKIPVISSPNTTYKHSKTSDSPSTSYKQPKLSDPKTKISEFSSPTLKVKSTCSVFKKASTGTKK